MQFWPRPRPRESWPRPHGLGLGLVHFWPRHHPCHEQVQILQPETRVPQVCRMYDSAIHVVVATCQLYYKPKHFRLSQTTFDSVVN